MRTEFIPAGRHALIAAATVAVLFGSAACTTAERSAGTSAAAPGSAGASFASTAASGADSSPVTSSDGALPEGTTGSAAPTTPGKSATTAKAGEGSAETAATTENPPTKGAGATAKHSSTAADSAAGGSTELAFPDQPAVVAAAKASVDQVVQLHALAVSAGHPDRIPGEVIPSSAANISDALGQQVTMLLALAPAADSEQAKLADALTGYRDLADQLAKWDPASEQQLDKKFFAALVKNDKTYLAALKALGKKTGESLTDGMPELLLPES